MSDIKLFRLKKSGVEELNGSSVALEKSLQSLIEKHLEAFLGIRFLATEYSTGKTHRGRIDTIGIDENGCPVIIEYKRATNENVINQGLYYLDWLMDHQAEFQLLVMGKFGKKDAESIEWSSPRLLCIAGDFTKYDEHAVQQINRNIELIRYRKFSDELWLFELVNAASATEPIANPPINGGKPKTNSKTVSESLAQIDGEFLERYESLKSFMLSLGDDVQIKTLKYYIAFRRIRNFACAGVSTKSDQIWLYLNSTVPQTEEGFSRDVTNIGHWGTGNLEIIISNDEDLERAKPLIEQSYRES